MVDGLKIVVAEGSALIGMDLAELLGELGHHVCALISTEVDAVDAAARCNPDMMIVDCSLAQGSGFAAMHRILERGPMPHVFLADDRRDIFEKAPNAIVVMKPFNAHDIHSGIAAARVISTLILPHLPQPLPCVSACQFPTCFQRL